ncbi:PD-(D/E)XK nuclease family protein [Thermus parvatiensis]|uniref:PD-(D/E)XK nuclease family protein n=1 Tax=Thermus parvatiensis TaxID=456163 RepID=UPI000A48FF09|nr:PD-(D/E)XK nuclease family protein [Thermus parvatiensis]
MKDPKTGALRIDLQLSLYILLHGGGRGRGVYYSLTTGKHDLVPKSLKDGRSWADALREVLRGAHGVLRDGAFEPRPDAEAEACRSCPVELLCRYEGR